MFSLQKQPTEGKMLQFRFRGKLPTPPEGKLLFLFATKDHGACAEPKVIVFMGHSRYKFGLLVCSSY